MKIAKAIVGTMKLYANYFFRVMKLSDTQFFHNRKYIIFHPNHTNERFSVK